jgi:hypothetical protein
MEITGQQQLAAVCDQITALTRSFKVLGIYKNGKDTMIKS